MNIGSPKAHLLTFLTSGVKAMLSFEDVRHPASQQMLLDGNHGPEEVTLFITGLIESKRTAPFHNNNQALPLFKQSVERLHELITMFEGSYPEHAVETWDLPTTTIQASNRYFTRSSDTGSLGILDLNYDIDPYGILAAAGRGRYVYTEDNKIDCFQMVNEPDGTARYEVMKIRQLREGDAVELNISLVAFPVRNSRNRVSVILRGVNLLDNHYSRIQQRHKDQGLGFRQIQLGKTSVRVVIIVDLDSEGFGDPYDNTGDDERGYNKRPSERQLLLHRVLKKEQELYDSVEMIMLNLKIDGY
ncbi:hypothetical protein C8J56DRAFT_880918 [Mycena floridula]|nr:hypothetical protein C8J56DRAFT_880918 [Mycena floridula]